MEKQHRGGPIILAVYPSTHGFGYGIVQGSSLSLVDARLFLLEASTWLTKYTNKYGSDKNAKCLAKVSSLMDFYNPDIVVVENYHGKASRRYDRIQRLIDSIVRKAEQRKMRVRRYSRAQIRHYFKRFNAFSKYEIAEVIAARMPELQDRLPARKRKIWLPEDYRIGMFDAMSLIWTLFYSEYGEGRTKEGVEA